MIGDYPDSDHLNADYEWRYGLKRPENREAFGLDSAARTPEQIADSRSVMKKAVVWRREWLARRRYGK